MILYKGFRIFVFSDTHGMHEKVTVPPDADILICVGDVESDSCDLTSFKSSCCKTNGLFLMGWFSTPWMQGRGCSVLRTFLMTWTF